MTNINNPYHGMAGHGEKVQCRTSLGNLLKPGENSPHSATHRVKLMFSKKVNFFFFFHKRNWSLSNLIHRWNVLFRCSDDCHGSSAWRKQSLLQITQTQLQYLNWSVGVSAVAGGTFIYLFICWKSDDTKTRLNNCFSKKGGRGMKFSRESHMHKHIIYRMYPPRPPALLVSAALWIAIMGSEILRPSLRRPIDHIHSSA